ncbi:F0F1 ATP synthase subunit epsilon [Alkaliphilus peptidifermentans]|uniref:ATP synthase epsilon chain n=1 Tax=Alkaliphilus peptidifermentans DSM 18978 TaxID=1120976 RepID=A0A1G5JI06_9FIRM|nr:F0F1 ATP synthase subunit epsilon [Alkaliphilus peptidifermentans]SCY87358.1 ATP synthase F1 subcomplex epsilon subunit [Alkaliphilus peptidifermentans DSM 18978]
MASKFHLQVIAPDKILLDEEVEKVIVRSTSGDIAILHDHIPMVAPLSIGQMTIINDGNKREAAVASGFVHIDLEKTVIMADAAEWPEEIDVDRAKQAKARAEDRLKNNYEKMDRIRAEIALHKALNRINVVEKKK